MKDKKKLDHLVMIRVDGSLHKKLQKMAKDMSLTKTSVIKILIHDALKSRAERKTA